MHYSVFLYPTGRTQPAAAISRHIRERPHETHRIGREHSASARIKSDPKLATTPIIAVSSFAMKGDEEKARAAGCNHT
jgi:CheY-like chemotaxis protein